MFRLPRLYTFPLCFSFGFTLRFISWITLNIRLRCWQVGRTFYPTVKQLHLLRKDKHTAQRASLSGSVITPMHVQLKYQVPTGHNNNYISLLIQQIINIYLFWGAHLGVCCPYFFMLKTGCHWWQPKAKKWLIFFLNGCQRQPGNRYCRALLYDVSID